MDALPLLRLRLPLVAVCQAAQALLNYQCDMALADDISITFPLERGYRPQEASISKPMTPPPIGDPIEILALTKVFGASNHNT